MLRARRPPDAVSLLPPAQPARGALREKAERTVDNGGNENESDDQEAEPESVHHAVFVYWLAEGVPWSTRLFWLGLCYGLACVQCYVMQGAADHLNPMHTDCEVMGNDACPESTFCMPDVRSAALLLHASPLA